MLLISSTTTLALDADDPSSLADLRKLIDHQLAPSAALAQLAPTVQLLACELVTNVKKHCRDRCCTFSLGLGESVRIEVCDAESGLPVPRQAGPEDESGRGFAIIAGLSCAWGCAKTAGGKRVWCEVSVE